MKKLITILIITTCCFSMLMARRDNKTAPATQGSNSHRDIDFVQKVIKAGMIQIQLSKLTQSNSGSSEIHEFATLMVYDHNRAKDELAALTEQNACMKVPIAYPRKHAEKQDKLSGRSSADFDQHSDIANGSRP